MTPRPCLTCGALVSKGSRCPRCQRPRDAAAQQRKRAIRPCTAAERDRRAAAVTEWVSTHGWLCPGRQRPAHPSADLTADHMTPVAPVVSSPGRCACCADRATQHEEPDHDPFL
jgi:hypothetical protein